MRDILHLSWLNFIQIFSPKNLDLRQYICFLQLLQQITTNWVASNNRNVFFDSSGARSLKSRHRQNSGGMLLCFFPFSMALGSPWLSWSCAVSISVSVVPSPPSPYLSVFSCSVFYNVSGFRVHVSIQDNLISRSLITSQRLFFQIR